MKKQVYWALPSVTEPVDEAAEPLVFGVNHRITSFMIIHLATVRFRQSEHNAKTKNPLFKVILPILHSKLEEQGIPIFRWGKRRDIHSQHTMISL